MILAALLFGIAVGIALTVAGVIEVLERTVRLK